MIACAVCGKPASAMTTLTNRLGEKTYIAERYIHSRDVCIAEWRVTSTEER